MKKSNRHISHLGSVGHGDGLSTKLNQDMNKPKISGGGFTGTADSNWNRKSSMLRVNIDDDESVMFPENEDIENKREKNIIRSKVPFDGRYKMRESKKSQKKLVDLFDDKFFDDEEDATSFKYWDLDAENKEKDYYKHEMEKIEEKDFNTDRFFSPPIQRSQKLASSKKEKESKKKSIKALNEHIKSELFSLIKEDIEKKGYKLVKKENALCNECGMMYEDCGCEYPNLEEINTMGSGNIAGYMTKLSTPKDMKKHKQKMLPTGYKYK